MKTRLIVEVDHNSTRRYVLYDYDKDSLATTDVYDSHNEAADDAAQLNNVMILALDLETVEPSGTGLADTADEQPSYSLNIDGPQLRAQRALLLKLLARTQRLVPSTSSLDEKELLEGLINLTDTIADQAHNRYGGDGLLDETDQPCECELPGHFCCGVPGILAYLKSGQLAADAKVERCDLCQRFPSDEAVLKKLRELGYDRL